MSLVPFAAVDRSTFRWLRTPEELIGFELRAGESLVGQLRWAQPTGSLARAEIVGAAWTFKRGGFLNPHVTVRRTDTGEHLARLTVHLNYHRVELASGRSYRFHRAGVLVPAWKVTADDGKELLHIEPVREDRRLSAGAVIVAPHAVDLPELALLVLLSWYFIVLAWFEDEALVPLEGPDAPDRPARAAPP